MADLTTQIETAAGQPVEVQNGDQKVKGRTLDELIAADKYLAAKQAVASRPGVLFSRIVPPGAQ